MERFGLLPFKTDRVFPIRSWTRLQDLNLLPSVPQTDALPNELNLSAPTRALPVVPSPFEPQNATRVMAFTPGGILPRLQASGICTLLPSSCQPPSFAKTQAQLTTGWDFFLFRMDQRVPLRPQRRFFQPSLCPSIERPVWSQNILSETRHLNSESYDHLSVISPTCDNRWTTPGLHK